eukprot:CAMPEP_0185750814 /NCGR_PEP_ID=MMETSP1174-20130828/9569_1 /TAXON_ID=35687 /ORGANISM="Dictyocha speculum, Strain CCMP1381" /LENGTH=126 /DNA_ID=CAMNT_0028427489 /DNA_START=10 /DNA_END=390 /DNA_ORIENTATION=+
MRATTGTTPRMLSSTRPASSSTAPQVLLASIQACGVGLNLTVASVVVVMDLWWNPAVENQAIDRVHRFGQERPVRIWRLTVRHTVEQKLVAMQARKRDLAHAALCEHGGGDGGKGMSLDELADFFR